MNVTNTKTGFICNFGFCYVAVEADASGYLTNITACVNGDEQGTQRIAASNMDRAVRAAIAHYTNPDIVAALKAIKAEMDEIDAEREPPRDFPDFAA